MYITIVGCRQRIVDRTATKRAVDVKTESCRFVHVADALRI
jgi:hypothetical protein